MLERNYLGQFDIGAVASSYHMLELSDIQGTLNALVGENENARLQSLKGRVTLVSEFPLEGQLWLVHYRGTISSTVDEEETPFPGLAIETLLNSSIVGSYVAKKLCDIEFKAMVTDGADDDKNISIGKFNRPLSKMEKKILQANEDVGPSDDPINSKILIVFSTLDGSGLAAISGQLSYQIQYNTHKRTIQSLLT
jgi:hypothetical protein